MAGHAELAGILPTFFDRQTRETAEHQRGQVRRTMLHIARLVRAGYSEARRLCEPALTQPGSAPWPLPLVCV